MTQIKSNISANSPPFKANVEAMEALVDDLKSRQSIAALGGGEATAVAVELL